MGYTTRVANAEETGQPAAEDSISEETAEREREANEDPLSAQTSEAASDSISEETAEREREADEDPLSAQTSELHEKTGYWYRKHTSLTPYASARYRYSISDSHLDDGANDAGTRAGLAGELQWRPRFWVLGRAEVGFNLFDPLNNLIDASGQPDDGDSSASLRLLYAGLSTPSTTLTVGKNWASYYQVSGLTDRFSDFGGEASGTYNAFTDGGNTGTGRADDVIQGRFSIDATPEAWNLKPFKLHVQYQPGEAIPQTSGFDYEYSLGISALLQTRRENFLGIAYNHAVVEDEDIAALKPLGIDGDARALILGTRRIADNYYLATTLSYLDNHETTDEGLYFDGWGWEAFASYKIDERWWVIGGWNALTPNNSQKQAREYQLRYGVIGLRFTFDEFKRMLYSEIRLDDSRAADGSRPGNVYAIGIRWDFP